MKDIYEKVINCYESIKEKVPFCPKVALILGSGLGGYGRQIQVEQTIEYKDIDGFPVSTVPGHEGRFLFGRVGDVPVVCMQGRVHYYEGYPVSDVVLPIRLMGKMGAEILFLTNAAGGANASFKPGDFMLITDQISNFVPSPLIGRNDENFGTRFPDMSEVYDKKLRMLIEKEAENLGISMQQGVYIQLTGPNYETPHEVKMCQMLGADAIGMSTAVEAIAAKHMGMRVCGISCITNMACGISERQLSHTEVQETADRVAPSFEALVSASIQSMGTDC